MSEMAAGKISDLSHYFFFVNIDFFEISILVNYKLFTISKKKKKHCTDQTVIFKIS